MNLQRGDRVRITGTVIGTNITYKWFNMRVDGGNGISYVDFGDGSAIEKLDPEHWPPQPGDIWEADGKEYFARHSQRYGIYLMPTDLDGLTFAESRLGEFWALSPKLVRRRDQG